MDFAETQEPEERDGTVAIVVLTHNREHLLRKCVENVLMRTSSATREIVIWNNASTDGTSEYVDSLADPRIRHVRSEANVGQNGYARAFALTTASYLVELDDDIVDAPAEWDAMLLDAFRRLPTIGFLAADLEDDPHDHAAHYRYRVRPHEYVPVELNGVRLLRGPTGGGCAMTSREIYDRAGGFRQDKSQVFFQEEAAYIDDIGALGYEPGILADLKVHHMGGAYYSSQSAEKERYWAGWNRRNARRAAIKRVLLRIPYVRRLNARRGWFVEPE